jgi:N-acetyl-1-D-myo-inositol-2-amino-2-deoxy-alpha-D-glucopyranoside deacetylase/mycothiol S-conjugate amidase
MFVGAHPDDESFGPGGTLAKYAAAGTRVIYACATRGEAGTVAGPTAPASVGDLRWAELMCAADRLGLAAVVPLGYRDSGMPGAPDQRHPRALVAAPLEDVARAVARVIRDARPQVVVTFDPIGGYWHPDHIAIHHATVRAFAAAADPACWPDLGTPFAPRTLYCWLPVRWPLRLATRALRLLGRDPARTGRNRDVDLTAVAAADFPVHARIRLPAAAVARKRAAVACHRSQALAGPGLRRLAAPLARWILREETFMRVHPVPGPGDPVRADLFEEGA